MKNSNKRIISLLPSASEIVVGLGLQGSLVGRSHECNFPPAITALPVLTEAKFISDGTSEGIHRAVSELVRDGLAVYRVDTELLQELAPNFIITQSQCELCAVSLKDVEQAVCKLLPSKPQILSLEPLGYDNIFDDFLRAGELLDAKKEAEELVERVGGGIAKIAERTKGVARRVVIVEWLEPLMYAGNWIPTLVSKAGGIDCLGKASEHSHHTSFEDIACAAPEVLLLAPCGFDIETSLAELSRLAKLSPWQELVANYEIAVCDGNQFFNRPGPRILETVEIIAEILAGLDFGHYRKGWRFLKDC